MRHILEILPGLILLCTFAAAADRDEFLVKRKEVFAFTEKPRVTRAGDRVEIAFTAQDYCDATVAIEDSRGKIIRHLASGVLGANAPSSFQKNSLAQTVLWDGKDDKGHYVDDKGACSVRVSLGLKPSFEKNLFWSPHKRSAANALIAAAPEGVYVYDGSGMDHLRLFDHEGNFLRTVYPFPANKLSAVQGLAWQDFPKGQKLPWKNGVSQHTFLKLGAFSQTKPGGVAATALAVHPQGRVALVAEQLNRLATDGSTGGFPLAGPRTGIKVERTSYGGADKFPIVGPGSAAFSPDGRTLYLTGYHWHNMDWRYHEWLHGVMKLDFEGDAEMKLFAGSKERGSKFAGAENGKFSIPATVDCDAQGRVYVTDHLNDRVQVFQPDGTFLKAIPVTRPAQVLVNKRSGDIYVSSYILFGDYAMPGAARMDAVLTHFGPFDNPRQISKYPLPLTGYSPGGSCNPEVGVGFPMALDAETDPPTLWVQPGSGWWFNGGNGAFEENWDKAGFLLLTEKDGKLSVKRDFSKDVVQTVVRAKPAPLLTLRQRLYVNPKDEQLYVAEEMDSGVTKSFKQLVKIDPASGKVALTDLPFDTEDICFDLDGLVYLRTDEVVARYDSASWREIPWDYGEERNGVSFSQFTTGRFATIISGLPLPGHRAGCFHEGGMHVSPKGNLVVQCTSSNEAAPRLSSYGVTKEAKGGKGEKVYTPTMFPGRVRWGEIHVWNKHGKLICEDALPGIGETFGVCIDREDALYILAAPSRVVDGKKYFNPMTGTLLKSNFKRGKVVGTDAGAPLPLTQEQKPKEAPQLQNGMIGQAWVNGADWFFGGVGWCGFNTGGSGCSCWNCRFDLDLYGRSFAPEPDQYSVAVVDSNGNLVLRVGQYGNEDSAGAGSKLPLGGDEVGLYHACFVAAHSDRRLFIADIGNSRIVSVKLGYHAEERVSLQDVPDAGAGAGKK